MAGIKAATESARKLSAKNDMQQIIVAIKAYYTDYGKYPVLTDGATGAMDLTYGGPNSKKLNGEIINVLRYGTDSNWSDSNRLNPREIHYLEIPKAKDTTKPTSGLDTRGNWFDPWGVQYVIFIDADYSGDIDVSGIFPTGLGSASSPGKVAVSVGAASVGFDTKIKHRNIPAKFDQSADLVSWR